LDRAAVVAFGISKRANGGNPAELITLEAANDLVDKAEWHFVNCEFAVSSRAVLNLIANSGCSAYDCEFVALAEDQRVPLITSDRQILHDFPETAVSLQKFVRE
jgi:predicted nucleic acid-binding protein